MTTTSIFVFQFHDGAIRSKFLGLNISFNTSFQFHDGAIRSLSGDEITLTGPSFNSTMVRLEGQGLLVSFVSEKRFNSTMVRLEATFDTDVFPRNDVSIPRWCD